MNQESNKNHVLAQEYSKLVKAKKIKSDKAQEAIITELDLVMGELAGYRQGRIGGVVLKKFFGRRKIPKGLYIWGGVGRGKSMLMDLLYEHLEVKRKKRVHFHSFMLDIHARMFEWRKKNNGDPIPSIAADIAKDAWVLCFDEFQVSDIGDAMIIGRLFENLFGYGVVVIATSNRPPDDLYKDGLQREKFVPFIALLKEKLGVIELASKQDYRLQHLKGLKTTYFTPLGKKADKFLADVFAELTNGAEPQQQIIEVQGRKTTISKTYGDVAWCGFADLCEKPLGAADYGEVASEFNTLILENIPAMTRESRNEAKRFVTLIDELYEHKTKLICSAEASPDKLYEKGDGSFEFERTTSRLIEMQSAKYLKQEHI
jgi:cell division protein ZapE